MPPTEQPWSVCLHRDDVPETGRHVHISADEATRAAIAALAGLRSLDRLEADFDLVRQGRDGLRVTGRVTADVGQTCVVSLEPVENTVAEPVELVLLPADLVEAEGGKLAERDIDEAAPELLIDGAVDLGALATEFFLLGLDPYPRKDGARFEAPVPTGKGENPFAKLAALRLGEKKR